MLIDNSKKILYVHTKADLKPEVLDDEHYISIRTGQGVESLIDVIVKHCILVATNRAKKRDSR